MEKYQVINIELADFAQSVIGETDGKVVCHMYLDTYKITENEKVNAEIMCDALNTYNQTPVLPSELLRQVLGMRENIRKIRRICDKLQFPTEDELKDIVVMCNESLKQIENE